MKVLWRHVFGKPDGFVPWLRCRTLGHNWERCYEDCCDARLDWCLRCHTLRRAA